MPSQFLRIGVGTKNRDHIRDHLLGLRTRVVPLVWASTYVFPLQDGEDEHKKGKVEYMYSLSTEGAMVVHEELGISLEEVRYPTRRAKASRQYFHRRYVRDVLIAFDKGIADHQGKVSFFKTDLDKV